MIFYASLVKSLQGLYYPIEAEDESHARQIIANSDMKDQWCSMYTEEEAAGCVDWYGGILLPPEFTKRIDYDYHAVEQARTKS